jgi:hypothetical protein
MVLGWAQTYPISHSPVEVPVLEQISPLFWMGLGAGFSALAGLVLTSESPYVHWIASGLFLLFLSAPQLLYLSWGSDAGTLPDLVRYARTVDHLDMSQDVAVHSYFQWPASILFHSFLVDALGVTEYGAIQVAFLFLALSVGGGLFILWLDDLPAEPESTRSVFWGVVLYFTGFYWLLNWQAVPYVFSLALFFPLLALMGRRTIQDKTLFLLFFLVGIESHALFGIWSTAIVAILCVLGTAARRPGPTLSLLLLLAVAQISVIIYKNTRFFRYAVRSMQGTYQALLETGASDMALARQVETALSSLSNEPTGAVLKALCWCDLAFVVTAFALGTFVVIRTRRLRRREIALVGAGSLHFLLGTVLAAIGTRSLQLVGMVPAFFVVDGLASGGRTVRKAILLASLASLILFPAAVIRSHQISGNFVKPSNLVVKEYLDKHSQHLSGAVVILDEGRIHATDRFPVQVYNPRTAKIGGCRGPYVLVDTPQFRQYAASVAGRSLADMDVWLEQLNLSAIYTSGDVILRCGRDCREWDGLWEAEP